MCNIHSSFPEYPFTLDVHVNGLFYLLREAWACSMYMQHVQYFQRGHAACTCIRAFKKVMQHRHEASTCSILQCMGKHHGEHENPACIAWACSVHMKHGHAARTCTCGKDMQQGHTAWTCIKNMYGHVAYWCMQHGHAAWTYNVNMQHGHASYTCTNGCNKGMRHDMQHGYISWSWCKNI